MFSKFTWAKFLGDLTTLTGIVGGAASVFGNKAAAIAIAAGVAVRAIASLVTTIQSGTATDSTGTPVGQR